MFVHLSDTHLGYSEFNKVDSKTGLNQREVDVYKVFEWVVDYILKSKPKFVIHTGDLFETPRPPNRTISFALSQLKKLSQAGIPVILISGNHSTPRLSVSGSIFESFKVLSNIHPIFKGKYETVRIGNFLIHCIPHCSTEEIMKKNIKKVKVDKKYKNILAAHAGITGSKTYQTGEFNEQKIPRQLIKDRRFDYIALGHYHRFSQVAEKAYFSGATERFSYKHAKSKVGFVEIDERFKPKFIAVSARPMFNFKLDALDLSASQIQSALKELAKQITPQSLVLVNVKNIRRETWLSLDKKTIEADFKQALILDLKPFFYQKSGSWSGKTHIDDLPIEFSQFVKSLKKDKKEKELIRKLGAHYLERAGSKT